MGRYYSNYEQLLNNILVSRLTVVSHVAKESRMHNYLELITQMNYSYTTLTKAVIHQPTLKIA